MTRDTVLAFRYSLQEAMKQPITLSLLALSFSVSTEQAGCIGKRDLDNDGVIHTIQSGPIEMLGNA